VGDIRLSRSVIPHHSIAIEDCEKARLQDRGGIELCEKITRSQPEKVAETRDILKRLESRSLTGFRSTREAAVRRKVWAGSHLIRAMRACCRFSIYYY